MALEVLKSLILRVQAPAGREKPVPKMLNPTNHMHPTLVGAFTLPSFAGVPLLPLSHTQIPATARQTAPKPELVHRDGFHRLIATNRPSNCGASAVRSAVDVSADGDASCELNAIEDATELLSGSVANSADSAQG